MSERLNVSWRTSNLVGFLAKVGDQYLNRVTLELEDYDSDNYTSYVIAGSRVGNSLTVSAEFPAGAPARRYDIIPIEAVGTNGSGAGGFAEAYDMQAGGMFTIGFNGAELTDDLGTDVDPAVALISLAEAKQYCGLTDSQSDSVLASLINSCSEMIAGAVGRPLVSKVHTEYYHGDGSDLLILANRPVVSISSINVDYDRAWEDETAIEAADYQIDKKVGMVRAWNGHTYWAGGQSNIRVVYTAGYTAGPSGTMPHDLKLAAKRLVDHQFRDGFTHRILDVASEVVGGANRSFREDAIPKDVRQILDRYQNYMPGPQFDYAD